MRKSKYLVLSSFYFDFNDDLSEIKEIKELFENQNILDLERFIKITNIKFDFEFYNLNFIYLHKNIESLDEYVFMRKKIQILDLSNCIKLKYIGVNAFNSNQIKQLKLPKNIETLSFSSFAYNKIQNLDLSNCIKLKNIEEYAFKENQIKQLKLPKNIEILDKYTFFINQIEILDLSNCTQLKEIDENAFLNNPLNEIKILDNINIDYYENNDDLWNKFAKYYHKNDKKAGDYKYIDNKWQWYPL